MDLRDLNDLDLNKIGEWPWLIKAILILFCCIGIGVALYYLDTEAQLIRLEQERAKEQELRQTFEDATPSALNRRNNMWCAEAAAE